MIFDQNEITNSIAVQTYSFIFEMDVSNEYQYYLIP